MSLRILRTETVKIFSVGAAEAAVICHGMYRPRGFLVKGTANIRVPGGLTIAFWALKGEFGIGSLGHVGCSEA